MNVKTDNNIIDNKYDKAIPTIIEAPGIDLKLIIFGIIVVGVLVATTIFLGGANC